jgi:hypothetical protein
MHNDLTLDVMEAAAASLGKMLQEFQDSTCLAFATKELRREYDARVRHEAKQKGQRSSTSSVIRQPTQTTNLPSVDPTAASGSRPGGRHPKGFNLSTYKGHSLGDVMNAVREYGTTDSFSTEPVSGSNSQSPIFFS